MCGLTFDMRGGRQLAKPDVGRLLDGRVRPPLARYEPTDAIDLLGATIAPLSLLKDDAIAIMVFECSAALLPVWIERRYLGEAS